LVGNIFSQKTFPTEGIQQVGGRRRKMKKLIYAASVLGTLISGFGSYADEYATRSKKYVHYAGNRYPIGRIYSAVKARDDYVLMTQVYFNREDLTYEFTYKAKDGSLKELVFDAFSG
jgi:hypothetical protein